MKFFLPSRQVVMVLQELQVGTVKLARLVKQEPMAQQELQVFQEQLAQPDQQELQDLQDLQARQVLVPTF
jgi:hypothetical protein